jgi:hypothetical protein
MTASTVAIRIMAVMTPVNVGASRKPRPTPFSKPSDSATT